MKSQTVNQIIILFTFGVNLLFTVGFVALGYVGFGFEDSLSGFLGYFLALAILSTNLYMIIKKSVQSLDIAIVAVLGCILTWCIAISSFDALLILLLYGMIFIPVAMYKHSIRDKSK